jgi:hypothetical protein
MVTGLRLNAHRAQDMTMEMNPWMPTIAALPHCLKAVGTVERRFTTETQRHREKNKK